MAPSTPPQLSCLLLVSKDEFGSSNMKEENAINTKPGSTMCARTSLLVPLAQGTAKVCSEAGLQKAAYPKARGYATKFQAAQ